MKAPTTSFVDKSGEPLSLLLYKRDSCPYCRIVMDRARELGLQVPTRDTEQDPQARPDLIAKGGKSQVPCLFVNGKPMYESASIVSFFEHDVKAAHRA